MTFKFLRDIAESFSVEISTVVILFIAIWIGWNSKIVYDLGQQVPQNTKNTTENQQMIENIKEEQEGLRRDFRIYACADENLGPIARNQLNCGKLER